jgi:predicted nucleotidyltransferase
MQTPEQFTEKLKEALGAGLHTVAIYGSAATGERTPKYSDINLIIIVEKAGTQVLKAMAPMVAGWIGAGNKAPVIVVENQIRRSQDVFPIEFSDIRDRHRLLYGDAAVLSTIEVRPADLRRQLEFELRSKLFLLRQAFVESASRSGAVDEVMARSLSSISALFRGVLRLLGERAPSSTPQVLRSLETRVPIDAEAWEAVWRLRQGERLPRGLTSEQLFDRLLAGLQNAVDFVDAYSAS